MEKRINQSSGKFCQVEFSSEFLPHDIDPGSGFKLMHDYADLLLYLAIFQFGDIVLGVIGSFLYFSELYLQQIDQRSWFYRKKNRTNDL